MICKLDLLNVVLNKQLEGAEGIFHDDLGNLPKSEENFEHKLSESVIYTVLER